MSAPLKNPVDTGNHNKGVDLDRRKRMLEGVLADVSTSREHLAKVVRRLKDAKMSVENVELLTQVRETHAATIKIAKDIETRLKTLG